jgi:hypothetical protein
MRKLLQSIGLNDPTDEQIEGAIQANDKFIAQLEQIRDRAQFGGADNGNAQGQFGELN